MIPKHLNRAYVFNALLYFLVALAFSLSLSWLLLRHLGLEFDFLRAFTIMSITLGVLILVWTFKKISLLLVLGILLIRTLMIFFSEDLTFNMFFSPLEDVVRMIESSIRWMLLPPGSKPFGAEELVPTTIYLLGSILSFLILWLRPLPFVALLLLVVPLFFYEGLDEIRDWAWALFLGLVAVLISFGYKGHVKDARSRILQLPSLAIIAGVLLMSILTFQYLPAELFYSQRANTWINDTFGEGPLRRVAPFSLEDVGFNNTLGGPITLSATPFMEVLGPNESFYLRGSVYDDYDYNKWSKSSDNLNDLFDQSPENIQHFHRVFGTLGMSQSSNPTISIIPRHETMRVLFHSGYPYGFRFPNSQIRPAEGAPDYTMTFNDLGDIYSDQPIDRNGYDITGPLTSQSILIPALNNEHSNLEESIIPKLRIREKDTRYRELLEVYAPELYELIYTEEYAQLDPYWKAMFIREYLQRFNYTLDVEPLREGEDVVEYLFRTREGYCTYYATALALLLRDAGIDSRYAEGFIAPVNLNSQDDTYHRVILENQAHAWTEVYVEGMGYLPLDATPSGHVEDLSIIPLEEEAEETSEPQTSEPFIPDDRPMIEEDVFSDVEFEELDFSDEEPFNIKDYLWLLLPLYLLWRVMVYYLRHQKKYLKLRYDPTTLVKRVWPDLLHLYELQGIKLSNEDTLRTSLLKVLSENSYWSYWNDQEEREGILRMLEEVHFAGKEADATHLDEFLDYYNSVEIKTKQKMPTLLWILRRFLWSRRHPL